MTLESAALLAEILAAVGVIISLIYLAAQVRQSNVVARTQARQSWIQLAQNELFKFVDHPAVFDAFSSESPSREDKVRVIYWVLASLRQREFEWFQHKDGVIDDDHFRAYSAVITVILGTPRTRKLWTKVRYQFDPGFATYVDDLVAAAPLSEYFKSVDDI